MQIFLNFLNHSIGVVYIPHALYDISRIGTYHVSVSLPILLCNDFRGLPDAENLAVLRESKLKCRIFINNCAGSCFYFRSICEGSGWLVLIANGLERS